MIVPMTKYTFLAYHEDYKQFIEELQDLGVVHIEEKIVELDDPTKKKYDQLNSLNATLKLLKKRKVSKDFKPVDIPDVDGITVHKNVSELSRELDNLVQKVNTLSKEHAATIPWGNFSYETIENLEKEGIKVRFFTTSEKNFSLEWETKYYISKISETSGNIYFVVMERPEDEAIDIDAEEVRVPKRNYKEIEEEIEDINKRKSEIAATIDTYSQKAVDKLEAAIKTFSTEFDKDVVFLNTISETDEKVKVLEGWVPKTLESKLDNYLTQKSIVSIKDRPTPEDKVPILLKNNWYSRLFEPVGKMFSLPAYQELDLTPFFAPFFMMFFGLCLGDAGYGLVISLATIIFLLKAKKDTKPVLFLGMFLGLATTLVGLLTGTVFGVQFAEVEGFKQYVVFADANDMFELSLYIGIIQILFGLAIQIANRIKQYGFIYGVSTFGTLILLAGAIDWYHPGFRFLMPVSQYMVYAGLALVLLFNDPALNIFIRPLKGLYDLYNIASGFLGDFLSYVRLFALGISSSILGLVVNEIAIQLLDIPFIGWLIFAIFLVVGHTGNLLLASLGAFVHPMRLTFVEFYKNAGFAGGGKGYKPFKKQSA